MGNSNGRTSATEGKTETSGKKAKDKVGFVKEFLDEEIERFSDHRAISENLRPFSDRMVQFLQTVRKVAEFDEELALSCYEEGTAITIWLAEDTKAHLDRM